MKKATYMVEIQIIDPKGEEIKDWGYVGKEVMDLNTDNLDDDIKTLNRKIKRLVEKYQRKESDGRDS